MFWQLSWISHIPLHFPLYQWFIPNSFSCWRQLNKRTFAHCSAERNNFSGTVVQNQTPCLKMSPVPNAACERAWDKSRFSWCVPRAGVLASMSFNTFKDRVTAVFSWRKKRPKNSKTRQGNKQKVGDVVIKAVTSHYPCTHCWPPGQPLASISAAGRSAMHWTDTELWRLLNPSAFTKSCLHKMSII